MKTPVLSRVFLPRYLEVASAIIKESLKYKL
jgi:hypothetical protein